MKTQAMRMRTRRKPLSGATRHDMTIATDEYGRELMQYQVVWGKSDARSTRWPVVSDSDNGDNGDSSNVQNVEDMFGVTVTNYKPKGKRTSNGVAVVAVSGPVSIDLTKYMPDDEVDTNRKSTMSKVRTLIGTRGLVVHNTDNNCMAQDVILFDSWNSFRRRKKREDE